jgi:hypothetical protein
MLCIHFISSPGKYLSSDWYPQREHGPEHMSYRVALDTLLNK